MESEHVHHVQYKSSELYLPRTSNSHRMQNQMRSVWQLDFNVD